MSKVLIVNRRVVVREHAGTRKLVIDPTAECHCCTEPDSVPCKCNATSGSDPSPTLAFANCSLCIPETIAVNIQGIAASGLRNFGDPTFPRSFSSSGPSGIAACLSGGLETPGPSLTFYRWSVRGISGGFTTHLYTGANGSGAQTIVNDQRVDISLVLIPKSSTIVGADPVHHLALLTVTGCKSGLIVFQAGVKVDSPGPGFSASYRAPYVTEPCKVYTLPGLAADWYDDPLGGSLAGPHMIGGTATVKPCCEFQGDRDCKGNQIGLVRWYKGRQCGSGELREVWAAPGWVTLDGTTSYRNLLDGECYTFAEADGQDLVTPPDASKWIASGGSTPSCAACSGQYIQVLDCDDDALLGYAPIASGTADTRVLGGVCVHFGAVVTSVPDGATLFEDSDFGSTATDCGSCIAPDCPTDNSDCDSSVVVSISFPGDCPEYSDRVERPEPQGDGTWYWEDPISDATSITIVCSGRYWVITYNNATEGGGSSYTYHKLRTNLCPSGQFTYVTDVNGCIHPPTITIA